MSPHIWCTLSRKSHTLQGWEECRETSVLKINNALYTHTSSCYLDRWEVTDEGDQPQRHSQNIDNKWWYAVGAPNRRPRKTVDVETRRKAFRKLLIREGQGRAPSK